MQEKEKLIQKLFANKCSKKELNRLLVLIQADEKDTPPAVTMTLLQQLGEIPALDSTISKRILTKVLTDIESNSKNIKISSRNKNSIHLIRRVAAVAAAIVLLFAVNWGLYQNLNPSIIVVATDFDERQEISLPDGSQVILNSNSSLQYSPDWEEGETRKVALQGEAYFEVEKKETLKTKFQVITRDLTVEVLGTVFNVNTRKEATKVFLEEGKVRLNLEDKKSTELFLKPGEVVSYSVTKKALISPKKVAGELEISWKDGLIVFRATPLIDVFEKLAATSNFEFEIKTSKYDEPVWTLALPNNDIEKAIDLISTTTGATINKNGNKYIVYE